MRPTRCCDKLIGAVAGEISSHYPGQKQITIVTAGLGTSNLPVRFGAPPDVWLVRVGPGGR